MPNKKDAITPGVVFNDLGLSSAVMKAVKDAGYETPTPIQAKIIPHILAGKDVLGQAQTGTGKTAAFALPLLSRIDLKRLEPQVLVLTPTRELAIQVAEAFQHYAAHMKGFHVLPIYGGQGYDGQLHQLRHGVHVIVGTPGRLIDHMRRKTLSLKGLDCLVLDEADEMLRMGFIDDVKWVLKKTPKGCQIALFSATLPKMIRAIAQDHLNDPVEVTIKLHTTTAETINQHLWMVSGYHKLDALTRILEAEPFDAMLVFVRTKTATVELSEKLEARGYLSAPLNGDIPQRQRERTVNTFKKGKLDILVATDVAARGLDVDRISHVINYDVPYDTESYIHRIGRTGRAGRTGEAILFVAPREKRMLRAIEKTIKQKIKIMDLPTVEAVNDKRVARFMQRITDTLAVEELGFFYQMIEQYQKDHNVPALEIAAALAKLVQGDEPMLLTNKPQRGRLEISDFPSRKTSDKRQRNTQDGPVKRKTGTGRTKNDSEPEHGMDRFRIEVGREHGVTPGNIVGAIANEAQIDSEYIGRISIYDTYSLVDLPEGMPREILRILKRVWVVGQQLKMRKMKTSGVRHAGTKRKPGKKKPGTNRLRTS